MRPLADHGAPSEPGVYVLYRNGTVMYVGKAISTGKGKGKLAKRLSEHARRIMSSQGISIDEMTCRYLVVDEDWMANAAEKGVIRAYGSPEWQGSGFGGHVPGAGRPGKKPRNWDVSFPPRSKGELERLRKEWTQETTVPRRARKKPTRK
jgi:hypothetical protein